MRKYHHPEPWLLYACEEAELNEDHKDRYLAELDKIEANEQKAIEFLNFYIDWGTKKYGPPTKTAPTSVFLRRFKQDLENCDFDACRVIREWLDEPHYTV